MKKQSVIVSIFAVLSMLLSVVLTTATELPESVILFKNVNIFDGTSEKLIMDQDVLIVKNKIHKIGKDLPTGGEYEVEVTSGGKKEVKFLSGYGTNTYTITVKEGEAKTEKKQVKVQVIDGEGRTLMPGLIEGHGHLQMNGTSIVDIESNSSWE